MCCYRKQVSAKKMARRSSGHSNLGFRLEQHLRNIRKALGKVHGDSQEVSRQRAIAVVQALQTAQNNAFS